MKILSSFTHPQVVPNLYEFLCFAEHKGRYFEESLGPGCFGAPLTFIVGNKITMKVNGAPELLCFPHSSEYLPLCSAEQRHSYRFGTTWGWVNDDRILFFWVNYPFNTCQSYIWHCQPKNYWSFTNCLWVFHYAMLLPNIEFNLFSICTAFIFLFGTDCS